MGISVTALIGGIVLSIVLKKRDCLAFFKDFIIVYEFNSIFNYGYRSFKYDEIKEYGFIHELEREAKELRMYLKSEVYNHGKMIILDVSGKKHKIPVNDIDKAKEFFKTYTCKDETVYQKLHGIHY